MKTKTLFLLSAWLVCLLMGACAPAAPQATATPTIDTAATQAVQSTATAQAENDAAATATAEQKAALAATANAKSTAEAELNAKNTQAAEQATNTAAALATLSAKGTADAQATVAAKNIQASQTADAVTALVRKDLDLLGVEAGKGTLGWLQGDSVSIKMDTAWQNVTKPAAEGVTAADFVFKSEITWQSTGILICTLIFRSEKDLVMGAQYNLNFLQFSGLPGWDIEVYDQGKFNNTVTGKVKFADALNIDNGDTNKVVIWVEGNKFTLYLNDQRIGSFFDYSNQRMDGSFGFYGSQESGQSTCQFANSWVWILK